MDELMQVTGNIQFTGKGQVARKRSQETINILQELMNKYGIIKIDVAINP